jgi:protein-disulfide isomerase
MKQIIILIAFLSILSSCTTPIEGNKWWETPQSNIGIEQVVSAENATVPTPTYWSGKHTIEIFADFQCPACIYFAENVGLAIEWFAEKWQVKIIYRQYPLVSIHKNAQRDALAALCAQEQGKYMEYKKVTL